ncbi:PRC-barrel domain-containing protein [Candidatus Saccharibacteria bacterium]|nr:PRC-barrel domain-containing protein [Candidatus Saccharibacteria bacterium]MBI3338206.1 PRC-barrel domain-containing protein [Candidatus Saccharibacteria bacterium]
MLQLSKSILAQPVMSLRTGGEVARAIAPIINPNNLKIEGFYCQDKFSKSYLILLSQDIRDVIPQGIAVNDHAVLTEPNELVRLKSLLDIAFDIMGKPVVTVSKKRIGKINDYAVEIETMYIQKIYVGQNLFKSFSGGQLGVDRNQIVEITDNKIIIQDLLKPEKSTAPASIPVAG